MLGSLSRARRFGLGAGFILLLLGGGILFLELGQLATAHAIAERLISRDWKNIVLTNRMAAMTNAQGQDLFLLFHVTDQRPVRERISERAMAIDRLLEELEGRLDDARGRELLAEVGSRHRHYLSSVGEVSGLLAAGQHEASSRRLVGEAVPALGVLQASVSTLNQSQAAMLTQAGRASLTVSESARRMLGAVLLASAVVMVILSTWVIRSVIRPLGKELQEARAIVEQIAGGHLNQGTAAQRGQTGGLLAAMYDMQRTLGDQILSRTEAENALRESQQRFQGLIETLRDQVWEVDAAWRYTYLSPQVEEILGYKAEELLGASFFDLMPPDEALRMTGIIEAIGARCAAIEALEGQHLHLNGNRVVLERSGRPFFNECGRLLGYRGLDRDITQRKEAEATRLAEAAQLRDALVREVHHRIKNNLQTVTSLLRRQADAHPEAGSVIDAALAQVQAVAVVHGLYGRVTQHRVLLDELLSTLASNVQELTGVSIARNVPAPQQGRLLVRENETVALALILNELLTNAVKHSTTQLPGAGPRVVLSQDGRQGFIRILNAGRLPSNFDFAAACGLGSGLGLVRALMPASGLSIDFRQAGPRIEVEVRVGPPVLDTSPRSLAYA